MNEVDLQALVVRWYKLGCIQFGEFTMKSGMKSPIYIDFRRLISDPDVLWETIEAMADIVKIERNDIRFDRIAAVPLGGMPIGTALSIRLRVPMIYPREAKDHGMRQAIEGNYKAGETILVVDDLITKGDSKLEAIIPLEAAGLKVTDILVVIDREQGGVEYLAERGYKVHSLMTLMQVLNKLHDEKLISEPQFTEVKAYLEQ